MGQTGAALKSKIANLSHAIGNVDAGQIGTALEGTGADRCYAVGDPLQWI